MLAVDDQSAFRDVVRELVEAASGMVVVAEAESGERAVELVEQLRPDLVLMDVRMPGIGGAGAALAIKTARPETVVVLVTADCPDEVPEAVLASRADEVVWKRDLTPRLLEQLWQRHRAQAVSTA